MEINPINKIKTAENPGLLEYAHTSGGAVIRPEDMGKVKGKAQLAMRQQTHDQIAKIYRQMELLAKQAKEIQNRVEVSERIYDAVIGFEPIIGHTYYLYEKRDGSDILSMVSPDEFAGYSQIGAANIISFWQKFFFWRIIHGKWSFLMKKTQMTALKFNN